MVNKTRFAWLDPAQRAMLVAPFTSPMPRGRGELAYRTPPRHLDQATVDGKRHVVFTAYYPQPALAKMSLALRRTGRWHTTFLGCCIREDTRSEDFFDQVYEVLDYAELYDLVANSSVWAVHAMIQPLLNGAMAVEAARRTGARAVVYINDSLYYMKHDPRDPECLLEARILNEAAAFTHKMPDWGVERIRRAWGLDRPDAAVHSLPVEELFQECAPYCPQEPARLAFAGGIIPYHIAKSRGHENHIMDPLIDGLCGQGFRLTFLVNQNAREMFWEEHGHYREFEATYPDRFSFRRGVPFFELPGVLRENHFAIYWENVAASSYMPEHFAINMATKIFSYLEAGLPIIIHDRADYMRGLVEEHGLGLVYRYGHLEDIPGLIASCDHGALRLNVDRWRRANSIATAVAPLERALGAQR